MGSAGNNGRCWPGEPVDLDWCVATGRATIAQLAAAVGPPTVNRAGLQESAGVLSAGSDTSHTAG